MDQQLADFKTGIPICRNIQEKMETDEQRVNALNLVKISTQSQTLLQAVESLACRCEKQIQAYQEKVPKKTSNALFEWMVPNVSILLQEEKNHFTSPFLFTAFDNADGFLCLEFNDPSHSTCNIHISFKDDETTQNNLSGTYELICIIHNERSEDNITHKIFWNLDEMYRVSSVDKQDENTCRSIKKSISIKGLFDNSRFWIRSYNTDSLIKMSFQGRLIK